MPELTLTPVDHNPFVDDATAAVFPETVPNPGVQKIVSGIGQGLADFVKAPGQLMQPNPYDQYKEPEAYQAFEDSRSKGMAQWAPQAALSTMGTGAVAGLPVNAGEVALGAGPIRAYHGSPHDFDAFSLDKIGTGEGAQAYGHGLYFAENEGVAKSYRDALAKKNQRPTVIQTDGPFGNTPILEQDPTRPGKMYEVQINADPEHFLDWDKPLSEQPEVTNKLQAMYEALGRPENIAKDYPSGRDFIDDFHNNLNVPDEGMAQMRQSGIPGIKYLDQGSRAAGEGSRNYVVFDDKLIDIIKKYGMAGLSMLPPATAAYLTKRIMPVDHDPFEQGAGVLTPVDHDPFAQHL